MNTRRLSMASAAGAILALAACQGSTSSSPDGQWTALTTLKIPAAGLSVWPDYHQQLRVFRADGRGPEWIAYDTWSPYGLGYTLPAPLRWSRSGGAL